ncbi:AbrB family transcriptional regulator [Sneathiella litorea]|uniref:AbrB family transcriptional regulator n=1 Tax=Sneathiella litorea TaxID=2606216 RepID=A0A6L8W7N8_9PROT|nr:AbrB family transcriptional regulator [Sneathiella litorea]MZR31126.1 AbrB family transcriptional regulator [Sneathiella litorea]
MQDFKRTSLALTVGGIGGALFFIADLPLAWMLGSMVFSTIAALRGVNLAVNGTLRKIMTAILGVMLGSGFSTDTFAAMGRWSGGLLLLLVSVALSMVLVYIFYRRVGKFDPITAYFSAAPGGLNVMYEVGEAKGGHGPTIALIHASRILILVMTVPLIFRYGVGFAGNDQAVSLFGSIHDLAGDGWLLVATLIGYFGGYLCRLPAYHLMGPLLATAGFQMAGITDVSPPMILVYASQLVIGTAIGARFLGTRFRDIRRVIGLSFVSTTLMVLIAAIFAYFFAESIGVSIAGIILALSPGGLAEMSLVALALGIDVAFVSTMHVIRISLIIALVPMAFSAIERMRIRQAK